MNVSPLLFLYGTALLVFAPITGYIAYNYGRSFWRWYALGLLLPGASVFLILGLAMREKAAEERGGR